MFKEYSIDFNKKTILLTTNEKYALLKQYYSVGGDGIVTIDNMIDSFIGEKKIYDEYVKQEQNYWKLYRALRNE